MSTWITDFTEKLLRDQPNNQKFDPVRNYEPLIELSPKKYVNYNAFQYEKYDGKPLPSGARSLLRYYKECFFVIFSKTSFYNKLRPTYDGRHNKMNAVEFRNYIKEIANKFKPSETTHEKKST